jgi:hypothetical protein
MVSLIDMRPSSGLNMALVGAGRFTSLPQFERGRGAKINPTGRFEQRSEELVDDGWDSLAELPRLKTEIFTETPKSIITRNQSPDPLIAPSIHIVVVNMAVFIAMRALHILTWGFRQASILNQNYS